MLRLAARTALLVLVFSFAAPVSAQPYPWKPIRLVVGFQPGGGVDMSARFIGKQLTEALGQSVIVDNKPGAGGNIASALVARAAADGYTLLMAQATIAMPGMFASLPFDVRKDFEAISLVAIGPAVLVVAPSLPAKNVSELISLARAKPGQLAYGSGGVGNITHLQMELISTMTGAKLTHIPYKGSAPGLIALMGGEIQLLFASIPSALPQVKADKVKPLAVSTARRSSAMPSIPTLDESGLKGYDAATWYGVFAPAGTPRPARDALSGEIVRTVRVPEINRKFLSDGFEPVGSSAEEFAKFVRVELAKWEKVIRAANIKAE